MPAKKKVLTKTARVKKGPSSTQIGAFTEVHKELDIPATFHEWQDDVSEVLANLDIHVYTMTDCSDVVKNKLITMIEEEMSKVVILLRKRIKAKSKKVGLGCRLI